MNAATVDSSWSLASTSSHPTSTCHYVSRVSILQRGPQLCSWSHKSSPLRGEWEDERTPLYTFRSNLNRSIPRCHPKGVPSRGFHRTKRSCSGRRRKPMHVPHVRRDRLWSGGPSHCRSIPTCHHIFSSCPILRRAQPLHGRSRRPYHAILGATGRRWLVVSIDPQGRQSSSPMPIPPAFQGTQPTGRTRQPHVSFLFPFSRTGHSAPTLTTTRPASSHHRLQPSNAT
jgi:hypothetical protein